VHFPASGRLEQIELVRERDFGWWTPPIVVPFSDENAFILVCHISLGTYLSTRIFWKRKKERLFASS
jgi:hypothetical protein